MDSIADADDGPGEGALLFLEFGGSTEYPHVLPVNLLRSPRGFPGFPAGNCSHGPMAAMLDSNRRLVINAQPFVAQLFAQKVLLVHQKGRRPQFHEMAEEHRAEHVAGPVTLVDFLR